ncbi:hypothetical protein D1Y84_13040 [Acidipila sp. EB88]|nr:hypothetical protein D1Y84_13040 [Acidipila sp. EB88]
MRDFLQYVGYGSLEPHTSDIHEHAIGVNVFGRSRDYDRSQDNIVRVNATELRRRIDRYFETEGAHESLLFSIPRGGYTPVFFWRELPAVEAAELPAAPPDPGSAMQGVLPVAPPEKRSMPWIWIALTAALVVVCCLQWWQNRRLSAPDDAWDRRPVLVDFWTSFTRSAAETDVVLPDASVTLSEEITNRPLSLWDYIHRNFPGRAHGDNLSMDRQSDLDTIYAHSVVMLGDFQAAQQLLTLTPVAPSLHVTSARFFEAEAIDHANVILIGGRQANPWTALFDEQLNFSLDDREDHRSLCIGNRHPAAGEAATYCPVIGENHITGYSVVAFLPNLGRAGKVLLLAGTESDATAAAAQFVTSEDGLNEVKQRLRTPHLGYFEALLKTSSLHGAPFSAQLLLVRAR